MGRIVGPRGLALGWVVSCTVVLALASPSHAQDTSLCDPQGGEICRTLEVANNCQQDVWVATAGNAAYCDADDQCFGLCTSGTCVNGGASCTLDEQCPGSCDLGTNTCNCTSTTGCKPETQVCDTTATPNQCIWLAPMSGGWHLASGASQTLYVPNRKGKSQNTSWSGRFWGRTGCPDFTSCKAPTETCTQDSDCCTNAGCQGLFTCTAQSDCNTWPCATHADCPGGTCNGTTNLCDECTSGSCGCRSDLDCRDGGKCSGGTCVAQCGKNGIACATGDCGGVLQCAVGSGGQKPFTIAEVELVWGRRKDVNGYDTYDVSQVDGFNLPVAVAPTNNIYRTPKAIGSEPWCGTPGCADGSECASLAGACSFDPTAYPSCTCPWSTTSATCPDGLQAVWPTTCSTNADCGSGTCDLSSTPPSCTCTSDSDCPGAVCGLNENITGQQVCGTYAGCMSPDDACATDPTLTTASLDCPTWGSLYACTGIGSCYTQGADSSCCGCPEWSPGGNANPPVVDGCQSSNSNWTTNVQPLVETFKNACPTAYSYSYDDQTSTFNCASKGPRKPLSYTITFCPTGAPGAGS